MSESKVFQTSLLKGVEPRDDWHREHQGPFVNASAYVWDCGDDYCNCTRAVIVEYYQNTADSSWRYGKGRWHVPVGVWEGEFHTDGEPGANAELIAKRAEMRESEPEYASLVKWLIWNDPEDDNV